MTNDRLDHIIIEDLEIYAYHGVYAEEKSIGQKFIVTAVLGLPLQAAAEADDLAKTVNYGDVCADIARAMTAAKYDLIEAAALAVADEIFACRPAVRTVAVTLKKPEAPVKARLKWAAVNIERTREDYDARKKAHSPAGPGLKP